MPLGINFVHFVEKIVFGFLLFFTLKIFD